uniref:Uncharacterized protein n=1 Tax=viral metagenome TaxID=1070528 RepID=A0A6C0EB60_9ZZZZ
MDNLFIEKVTNNNFAWVNENIDYHELKKETLNGLMVYAINENNKLLVLKLLDKIDITEIELSKNSNIIMMACAKGRDDIIQMLLDNPRYKEKVYKLALAKTVDGSTPLMMACAKCNIQTIKMMLKIPHMKTLIDESSDDGFTALMFACTRDSKIVKLLLSYKLNLNKQNLRGTTALIIAVCAKKADIVRLLVKHGADIEVRDMAGYNAMYYAKYCVKTKNVEIEQILLRRNKCINWITRKIYTLKMT